MTNYAARWIPCGGGMNKRVAAQSPFALRGGFFYNFFILIWSNIKAMMLFRQILSWSRSSPIGLAVVLAFWAASASLRAQTPPNLAEADRIRLAEVFRAAEEFQERIWPGWSRAPFAVLIVTPGGEYLVRHPNPSADFQPLPYDSILQRGVQVRQQRFNSNLLATFPAIDMTPTIVVGTAEQTKKRSALWVVTLLHEHFHQLQMSQTGYFAAVESLDLSGGDQSGMWMLNYPFPYDSANINGAFADMCQKLSEALKAERKTISSEVENYLKAKRHFQESLSSDDYKYFSFQLWQEGYARYTELRMAELLASKYKPGEAFKKLLDFTTFQLVADSIRDEILSNLPGLSLKKMRRVGFYYVGAAEGMLLDRAKPDWKKLYFKENFSTDRYFQ